jgi:SRSO17 transposase
MLRINYLRRFRIGARGANMNRKSEETAEVRFAVYVDGLASVLGHADRVGPLRDYCTGLILPGERKSVEPMAAKTAPARAAAQHQSLLHFVGVASWSDEKVLAKVREMVLPAMERQGPIEAWIIDDTGFPKQGKHSVGVQHQYCGQLGKEANCQVAVSLSIANHSASLPVAYRLYLPKEWSTDRARRNKAGVPRDIRFKTKPEIALEQIRWACESGLPRGVALIDGAYGTDSRLRTGMTALGVSYVVGIQPKILVWPPGTGPKRRGKLLNNTGRRDEPDLISAKRLARDLPQDAWRTIRWREGSAEWLSSRFARVRVRVGHSPAQAGIDIAGVVADRMARGRSRADQILAVDAARRYRLARTRRPRQVALAYRAGLSGAQAGSRARAL